MEEVTLLAALTAGLLSFVSPCVLPLVPAYLSYMTGVSVDHLRAHDDPAGRSGRVLLHSLAFVTGFSVVFILLGASATALGRLLLGHMTLLAKVGGVFIVVLGLHYMGLFRIGILNMEARLNLKGKPAGVLGSFLVGFAFAFGWTPCVGPILAAILAIAGAQEDLTQGILLLAVYSAGLGIPFVLAGVAINAFFAFFQHMRAHLHKVEIVSGMLLVGVGVMIFFGDFTRISSYLLRWFPGLASLG